MNNENVSGSQEQPTAAQRAREWIASENGRQAVERVAAECKQAEQRLMDARRIDPETLKVPVTM